METLADFFSKLIYVYTREVAGIGGYLFYTWTKHFLQETEYLRRDCKKILMVY